MKNKIKLLLPFSVNSESFAPAFYGLFTTSFSLYPFIFLLYHTGQYFTFSHNKPAKQILKERGRGQSKAKKAHLTKIY